MRRSRRQTSRPPRGASRELAGTSGSLVSSPLPRRGSTVSPSARRSQVVGLPCAPSLTLTQSHRVFEGLLRAHMPSACGPRDLRFSFRDVELGPKTRLYPSHAALRRGSGCPDIQRHPLTLTWVRAPLMGFSKDAPPSRQETHVHSRTVARPSVGRCHTPDSFRPCRSSRLRRFAPRAPRRSVAPCTRSWGSVRFGPWSSNVASRHRRFPAPPRNRASHPSELSPRRPPYRVTAALALPLFCVPSDSGSLLRRRCASPRTETLNLRALLCRRVRCCHERCRSHQPDALLGFVPLQGPPRILCS